MKKTLRYLLWGLLALLLTTLAALVLIVKLVLAPSAGEWSARMQAGPIGVEVGVPTAIRLATSHWVAPRLHGRSIDTRHGPVRFAWNEAGRTLEAHCAPCGATVPALGAQPLQLAHLRITLRREGDAMAGRLEAAPAVASAQAPAGTVLRGQWSGQLSQRALRIDLDMADSPIAHWYAVFVPALPELQRAQIDGTLGLRVQATQPSGEFSVRPRIAQFSVGGLGTEAMLGARTACGAPSRLGRDSWLARAVIAAEDQRFFQHPGYDLVELTAALEGNQKEGVRERGASTLTQQLAKMLVTGGERTVERKLRELLYAVEMEQTLGKARILQLYLDNAPWGPGTLCGAEAAARHYFKRSAARLEPAQAVWLASMLHAPVLAAERWAREGSLDAKRLQWVAEGVRGINRRQREALLKSVETARYPPP